MDGHFRIAILCLALSGLCDTFDGKIARTKKNRTEDQKLYGIQLDSLCDVVCFGIFPAMICYLMGVRGLVGGLAICYYCVCGVIRLAYFNVLETNRQTGEGGEKVYHGLPITSIAVILPLTFLLGFLASDQVFRDLLVVMLLVVGTLFIVDFRLKKPKNWMIFLLIAVVAVAVALLLLFARHKVARQPAEAEAPLIDVITEDADD
jgi:CDP-diacylglycerol--serine O-phosphatidyltransferase